MIDITVMRAAGLTDAQILKVIEVEHAERRGARREQNRINKQNQRARQHVIADVADGADGDDTAPSSPSSFPPTPPLITTPSSPDPSSARANEFDEFWIRYPNKVAKRAAAKAFGSALKRVSLDALMAGLDRYVKSQDPQFYCHPATWLNADRWLDQPAKIINGGPNGQRPGNPRNAHESAVLAGFSKVFGGGDGDAPRPADPEIPRGRFEFDLEPTRRD